jgi:hypothetical protein
MSGRARGCRLAHLRWTVALALGVALLATACGYDNPGEPRTPAEELSAPNLGKVHVYCVEDEHVVVTVCSVDLAAKGKPSRLALRNWWLRAARSLHRAGRFTYKDADWRFDSVFVEDATFDYGWRCPGDARHTKGYVVGLMVDRVPGGPHGIETLAAANKRGCTFARMPDTSA